MTLKMSSAGIEPRALLGSPNHGHSVSVTSISYKMNV